MTAVAQTLVRCYPQAWRDRYADEVLGLIESGGVTLIDLVELARGCVVERAKAVIEPGTHPTWTFWGLGAVATILGVVPSLLLVLGAMQLGGGLRQQFGAAPAAVTIVFVVLFFGVVGVDIWVRRNKSVVHWRVRLGLVALYLVWWTSLYWGSSRFALPSPEIMGWALLFIWVTTMHRMLGSHWPWRPIFDALERYQAAVERLRWARMEADRCRTLAGAIARSELIAAETQLAKLERERDDALAQLNSQGYRSRFRA